MSDRCLKFAECNGTCIRSKDHDGKCWHCQRNGDMPEDVTKLLATLEPSK